jgi:hypothetical protein
MGLMIHSLGELPSEAQREYYIYLLDYGWDEPLKDAINRNFYRMAELASYSNAVVLKGTVGHHFSDEVLSWHHINGQPGENILPAIMITTRHPLDFRDNGRVWSEGRKNSSQDRLLLIPLKKVCKSFDDVVSLIDKIFRDIAEKKALSDFEIVDEMKKGMAGAIVDALILEPNFAGVGINLNYIIDFFKGRKYS